MVSLSQIRHDVFLIAEKVFPKIPKAIGSIVFSASGVVMARECFLIAQGCAIEASKVALATIKEKALESTNRHLLTSALAVSVCEPQFYMFAAMGLGTAACTSLAYRYARDVFFQKKPELPPGPPPVRIAKSAATAITSAKDAAKDVAHSVLGDG